MTSTIELSDMVLVSLGRAGDPAALDQLARRYWREALRLAFTIVRSHADAEDVAQDALWAAFTHLSTFREDAMFRTWLHRIVVNQSLVLLRRRRSRGEVSEFPVKADLETPEDLLLEAERKALLDRRLNALPNAYSAVLRLATTEERSLDQIAGLTGLSIAAVKSRLHRARLTLTKTCAEARNSTRMTRRRASASVTF